jgi:hypothetical protein
MSDEKNEEKNEEESEGEGGNLLLIAMVLVFFAFKRHFGWLEGFAASFVLHALAPYGTIGVTPKIPKRFRKTKVEYHPPRSAP